MWSQGRVYALKCDGEQAKTWNTIKLLYSGIAHQPCNEDVQPQVGIPIRLCIMILCWQSKNDWWIKTMLSNAQHAKCKQVKTQHVYCQNESIITNKSIIRKALPSWKMLNLKSKRCMKAQLKNSRIDLHPLLVKRNG